MRREDGLVFAGPYQQRDDGAGEVLEEGDAGGRRVVGAALGEGQRRAAAVGVLAGAGGGGGGATLAGGARGRGAVGASALGHLDVGGRAGGRLRRRRIANRRLAEALGHINFLLGGRTDWTALRGCARAEGLQIERSRLVAVGRETEREGGKTNRSVG